MTTDNATQPETKKSSKKTIWTVIVIIFAAIGINHFTFQIGYSGAEVVITDSTISVTPVVDTVRAVSVSAPTTTVSAIDATKKDTTKKK